MSIQVSFIFLVGSIFLYQNLGPSIFDFNFYIEYCAYRYCLFFFLSFWIYLYCLINPYENVWSDIWISFWLLDRSCQLTIMTTLIARPIYYYYYLYYNAYIYSLSFFSFNPFNSYLPFRFPFSILLPTFFFSLINNSSFLYLLLHLISLTLINIIFYHPGSFLLFPPVLPFWPFLFLVFSIYSFYLISFYYRC